MTEHARGFTIVRGWAIGLILLGGCGRAPESKPPVEDRPSGTQVVDAWSVACVAPTPAPSEQDSATALLLATVEMWNAERNAFRQYQRLFCDDCAMFERSAPQFFASSTNMIARIAERFQASAAVACAEGLTHLRNASLGEGAFDATKLDRSIGAFERGLRLNPAQALEERLRAELSSARELRPRS